MFFVSFENINECLQVFKEKCPSYCKIRIKESNDCILAVNSVILMKKLMNSNIKSHYNLLKSELIQPFLVLHSKFDIKISQFEYEFYVSPLLKRKVGKKFFNEKFQQNFQIFFNQNVVSGRNFNFERNLDQFIENCCIDYLKQYYALDNETCFDELLNQIVKLSVELNQRLTLSLLLRQPRRNKNISQQENFTILYKSYLQKIEILVKMIDLSRDLNSFKINCLNIREITLNIRMAQVFLKELLYEAKQRIDSMPTDKLRAIDFIKYENLWSVAPFFKDIMRLTFIKIRQFDLFKIGDINDVFLFNDGSLKEKNIFLLFNLASLNDEELDDLFEHYYTDNCFTFDLTSCLFVNILSKIDLNRIKFDNNSEIIDKDNQVSYLRNSFEMMRLYPNNYINEY